MMQPYSEGTFDDVAKYKFEQAEDDLEAAKTEHIIPAFMRQMQCLPKSLNKT